MCIYVSLQILKLGWFNQLDAELNEIHFSSKNKDDENMVNHLVASLDADVVEGFIDLIVFNAEFFHLV